MMDHTFDMSAEKDTDRLDRQPFFDSDSSLGYFRVDALQSLIRVGLGIAL